MKKLAWISFGIAFLLSMFLGYSIYEFKHFNEEQRLEALWRRDIQNLTAKKVLHKGFSDIKNLEVTAGTEQAKIWLEKVKIPIAEKKDGKFKLEILLMSWEDEGKKAAVIQYNLVRLDTNDMVWELGRTFYLNDNSLF